MQKEPTKLLKVAPYIRVSSDEQAQKGDSVRDQRERTIGYINDHDNMILQDVYIDDGISGQKLERDEFQRLLENVRSDQIDLIVFTKLDRWFRSLRHYLNTQAVLEEHNVAWIALDQPYFDTSTPYGQAFVSQSMMWAELEAKNGGLRVKDVFSNKVKYGEVITGKVPRGYKIENKHLVFGSEAPAIYDSIMHFNRTYSINSSIKLLEQEHGIIMTMQNFKNSILKNEKYIGRYRGNDHYCPALISEEIFNQNQEILQKKMCIKSNQRYSYIFSGLLVCDSCGRKMGGCHINVKTTRKSGKEYRYKYPAYECKYYRAYKRCSNGGEIREASIEDYMLSHVRDELSVYAAKYQSHNAAVIDNRAKKKNIEKKIERLKELYLNDLISLDEYKKDKIELTEQLEALPDIVEPQKKDLEKLTRLLESDFEAIYETFDNLEKRTFWRSIIKEIRVSKSQNRHRTYTIIFC